jgi:UDP-GlcNAc:undecaprenyl-phosphate/decaprenyl-phosphate GlcNAc-1-phosphate transferase
VHYLALFAGGTVLSALLTRQVRNAARKHGWGCSPVRDRDVHTCLMPRVGGIGVYLAVLITVGLALSISELSGHKPDFSRFQLIWILGCGTLVFALGLLDDLKNLSPYAKFSVQVLAGALLYCGGLRISVIPVLFGPKELGIFASLPLTILWVLLISNAFNLIDGLDGLSAGSALFSTVVVFVVSLVNGNVLVSVLAAALAGALIGFLRYNFSPATIFLGDCGSLFLGFMLSALSIAGTQKDTTLVAVTIPLVSFGLPLLDTGLAVLRRFLSGQSLFSADRNHIHHRLLQMGFSHRQVVIILYGVSAALGLLSLLLLDEGSSSDGVVLVIVGFGIILGVQHLGYHEFAELRRAAKRTIAQKDMIANNLAVRRACEELLRAEDLSEISAILTTAFGENDFDELDLKLHAPVTRLLETVEPFEEDFDGTWHFRWSKAPERYDPSPSSAWTLTIELAHGNLSLSRFTGFDPLVVDISLLTSEFQQALSIALARSIKGQPDQAPVLVHVHPRAVEAIST